MCAYNFRVKVDLSRFYDDVRRSSWVYIDKETISCICHLEKHITKVFDICRSVHLLLNGCEYLPPNEDARILKENETVLVVPGTGLLGTNLNLAKVMQPPSIPPHENPPIENVVSPKVNANESSEDEDNSHNPMETALEGTMFLSMINDSIIESANESKTEASILGEVSGMDTLPMKNKRKRVRRRKAKNGTNSEEPPTNEVVETFEPKKPKIINSVSIPNGKHIRFSDVEKQEIYEYDSSASNDSRRQVATAGQQNGRAETYWDKPAPSSSLSNLLALRQSSTPITFIRQRTPDDSRIKEEKSETKEPVAEAYKTPDRNERTFTVDPKKHPIMENKARINDVVAFKMLKMASDYTPQVSEYIIAQPIQILSDRSTYVFKVLDGKDEVQAPQGKFDLETDETESKETDVIALSWSQLIEPRLIYRE